MVFKIALGFMLGFLLLGVLIVVIAVISAGIVRMQDRINDMKPVNREHWRDKDDR